MSVKKVLSGFITVTGGQTLIYGLSFLRNLILARMLTRADFGLAATFALTIAIFELTGKLSIGRQVVQAKDGDTTTFLNSAHSFQLVIGAIGSGTMLAAAFPMAYLFKVPGRAWAFALLAPVLLLRGFLHLDVQRRQRHFEFLPSIYVDLFPQIVVTAIAWPLAAWIPDFRAVLILLLSRETLVLLASHVLARHPYRLSWDPIQARRMWRFGWPLILNGFLIFAAQGGDQMLVGSGYSLQILALYAVAASLIAAPFTIMAQGIGTILLPTFAKVQEDTARFRSDYRDFVFFTAIGAMATMLPLIVAGEQALKLLYGSKYAGGGMIMAWLAAACALRFLRIVPATAAMAKADTQNQMVSNIFRASSLPMIFLVIALHASVTAVAECAAFGQLVALAASTWLLKRRQHVPISDTAKPAILLALALATAGASVMLGVHVWPIGIAVGLSLLLILITLGSACLFFPGSMCRLWRIVSPILLRCSPLIEGRAK